MKPKPVIKWSGSKRSQASEIISHFPDKIDTYYEPFCGGCSVAFIIMYNQLIGKTPVVHNFVLSDTNRSLVQILNAVKTSPQLMASYYTMMWDALKKIEDIDGKKEFYNKLRDKYNEGKDPYDFMVLNRLCYNGMIRYNSKGEFNSPFHINRDGIRPDKFKEIVNLWHEVFNSYGTHLTIVCQDYTEIKPTANDFVYMDPPYANTKGMYNSTFSDEEFFDFLRPIKCSYAFSYNGKSGNKDQTVNIPEELYTEHYYIKSGNSSFKRLKSDKSAVVYESLYLKKWMN